MSHVAHASPGHHEAQATEAPSSSSLVEEAAAPSNATILDQDQGQGQDQDQGQGSDTQKPLVVTEARVLPNAVDAQSIPEKTHAEPPPKPVFSLFLSPEERKKRLEAEAADSSQTTSSGASTPASAPIATSNTIDPNLSKSGETHRFFQEVKVASKLRTSTQEAEGDPSEGQRLQRRYSSTCKESPLPQQHEQYHGSETLEAVNRVITRICGLDPSSPNGEKFRQTWDSQAESPVQPRQSHYGWYSQRSVFDLGIQPPIYSTKPRGKEGWTHWGKGKDAQWRTFPDRVEAHRLSKPTKEERALLATHSDPSEFESCHRVAENQILWQQTWASALLQSTNMDKEGSDQMVLPGDIKFGELWTEKYHPHQGADVLGNRAYTEYLTEWLRGLEVSGWSLNPEDSSANQSKKGGAINTDLIGGVRKRRPTKKVKRRDLDDLDDFVVDDTYYEEDDFYGDDTDGEAGNECLLFPRPKPSSSFNRLSQVPSPSVWSGSEGNLPGGARVLSKKVEMRSNTILLSGPTGSGKTAAVYACAEECEYEVFEVNPGLRRTGREVLGLVGEMAENHHVHVVSGKTEVKEELHDVLSKGQITSASQASTSGAASTATLQPTPAPTPAPAAPNTLFSFFQPKTQPGPLNQEAPPQTLEMQDVDMEQGEDKSEGTPEDEDVDIEGMDDESDGRMFVLSLPTDDTPTTTEPASASSRAVSSSDEGTRQADDIEIDANHEDTLSDLYSLLSTTNPRQSLILLEEVDILFEEDKGFWTSVLTLLSKSKRPIVMTCNDTSKIPTDMLRFQEHLEFSRPSLPEIQHYLASVCKIEGYICSAEYLTGLIKQCQYDLRKCLMQLQYDSGVIRRKKKNIPESNGIHHSSSSSDTQNHRNGAANSRSSSASPQPMGKRKPQRLLRISAKGIIPASAPTAKVEQKRTPINPAQELEQLEVHASYAEALSLLDSELRMKSDRVFQVYDIDQFEASKDDVLASYLPIYKRSFTGNDHLSMDQELSSVVEAGSESLYSFLSSQYYAARENAEDGGSDLHLGPLLFYDDEVFIRDDSPWTSLEGNYIPKNDEFFRTLQRMRPALDDSLSFQSIRFNLDVVFDTYAPALRAMIQAEELNTAVPTGKRTMRSGGHLRRHLYILSEQDRQSMLLTMIESSPSS
ncbi:hypothetical protein BGW38_008791 [Lunasporangiospora selenospora]|uniref:AAA+ ATPase domain-containing protein n=1 Tax=Lunasporangiospora selenospora TaxID=979761 RepID=A0A9P6FYD8_9FUNG|nr:hypothetical protein BGW38_008791 [Lunasporangiospora selenospora]